MARAHKSWVIKYCILAPSIFSITTEVFSLHQKMCISSCAPSIKHLITVRFTGNSTTVQTC